MVESSAPLLRMENISKSYGGVRALQDVGVRSEVVDEASSDLRVVRSSTRTNHLGRLPGGYLEQLDRAHTTIEQDAASGRLVGLFQPDTLQAFRSDNVTGWLRAPQVRSLVVFAPTVVQYSQLVAAPPPPGEEASTRTYAVGAIGVLALCLAAFAVAAWIRRRFVA